MLAGWVHCLDGDSLAEAFNAFLPITLHYVEDVSPAIQATGLSVMHHLLHGGVPISPGKEGEGGGGVPELWNKVRMMISKHPPCITISNNSLKVRVCTLASISLACSQPSSLGSGYRVGAEVGFRVLDLIPSKSLSV